MIFLFFLKAMCDVRRWPCQSRTKSQKLIFSNECGLLITNLLLWQFAASSFRQTVDFFCLRALWRNKRRSSRRDATHAHICVAHRKSLKKTNVFFCFVFWSSNCWTWFCWSKKIYDAVLLLLNSLNKILLKCEQN